MPRAGGNGLMRRVSSSSSSSRSRRVPFLCCRLKKKKLGASDWECVEGIWWCGRWYVISGGHVPGTIEFWCGRWFPLRHAFRHSLEQNFGQLAHLFSYLVQSVASCNEVLPVRIIESQCQSGSTRVSQSQSISVRQCLFFFVARS